MRTPFACMLIALLGGCVTPGQVAQDRFRAEYSCPSGTVRWMAGNSYRATGCDQVVVYTCVDNQTCVRESGEDPGQSRKQMGGESMAWRPPPARVDRHYDQTNQALVVQGDFTPGAGVALQLLGAPKVKLGDIAVHVVLPKYLANAPCDGVELLINGAPTQRVPTDSLPEGYRTRFIAHFDFQQFKPLAQRFPAFGVRRCNYEIRLSDADVRQLQKFLAIYSDIAVEAESESVPAGGGASGTPISL